MNTVDRATVDRRIDRLKSAVRSAGVKLTHQRLEIFREVASSLEHPDADAVFRAVRRRVPTLSIDTVYRTLWMLNGLGLVTTLGPRRESVRFDANLDHHHHYVCTGCGLARDFVSPDLDALGIPDAVRALAACSSPRSRYGASAAAAPGRIARTEGPALPPADRDGHFPY